MSTILILLSLIVGSVSTNKSNAHKFYMSITEIEYKEEAKSLQITMHLFTDDFEQALEEGSNQKIRLGTEREHKKTDDYIKEYFFNNFSLETNGKVIPLEYLGKEVEINKTYCYIEAQGVKPFEALEVTNKTFFELFDSQKNIIHLKYKNKKRSVYLTPNRISALIKTAR